MISIVMEKASIASSQCLDFKEETPFLNQSTKPAVDSGISRYATINIRLRIILTLLISLKKLSINIRLQIQRDQPQDQPNKK